MNESSAIRPEDLLDSWKDIAAYLKRDISTVQRWERREGMPVHRHVHDVRGSVYAFRSELDVWLDSRRRRLEQEVDQPTAETAESVVPAFHRRPIGRYSLLAGAMMALGAAATYLLLPDRIAPTRPVSVRSLAVLPLQNLSADPAQEFFVDGMTDALIGRLSRIPDIRVISRTSAMHFKGTRLPLPEIARALQVDAIIEGSVVRSGSRLRISVQLIRAATDDHLWSGNYDRELRDVLNLQDEVAQAIARQIQITIGGQESGRRDAPRVSPDAYEDYLRGRFALNQGPTPRFDESVRYFEAALAKDPSFAPAYSGLATAYNGLGSVFGGAPPPDAQAKATRAAQQALELDSQLAEAHVVLAEALLWRWQWTDAEASYARAIDLNPNEASAHAGRARWLLAQGRVAEALVSARRARELDPLALYGTDIGWILFHARRYSEAIRELQTVLAVRPDDSRALWFVGFALIEQGQPKEAVKVLERTASISNRNPAVLGVLARAYARAGRRTDALRIVDELNRRRLASYVPPAAFVNAYLGLADHDQTFVWLERAYQERSGILQFLKVHPFFDPVRGDPRFAELVRRLNFPD
ncbi:MAG TPA: tetratricopeptide repeat protein [Vicinamibacterales bacterium]|nr:tetratricopeptide repeat protein [Vicinamibacterales bacterium]